MAAKKRQHYVPRFLLHRFAAREGRWQGHIFRLDTKTGRPRPAVPRTEAAKNRYYDLPDELVGEFQPERILERIESGAAAAISRLEAGHELQPSDVIWLAYFSSLQTSRTPLDRAERRYLDEVMAQQLEELRFSAREQAVAFLRRADPTLSEAQAEERRREILDDLGAGRIRIESTAEREVAGMFLGLNEAVGRLVAQCDWTLVRFAEGPALVLPDSGYMRYDPQPQVPGSGSGFLGTDTIETVIPVSPTAALVITRGSGRVGRDDGTAAYAEDLNLRAHAQARSVCTAGRKRMSFQHTALPVSDGRLAPSGAAVHGPCGSASSTKAIVSTAPYASPVTRSTGSVPSGSTSTHVRGEVNAASSQKICGDEETYTGQRGIAESAAIAAPCRIR